MTNKERLSEINNVINKLLSSKTIGTRYVAGCRYICVECGARSEPVISDRNAPPPSIDGTFDLVKHTEDCLLANLIKLIRGY
jgi:hypothetical protein